MIIWGLLAIVVGGLVINKWISSRTGKSEMARPNRSLEQIIAARAHILKYEPLINKVLTTGTVIANEEVELRAEAAGRVTAIYFREGGRVQKGDLLVKLNDADLQAQLSKALSRKTLAESNESRQRALLEKQLLSQEVYDAALNELKSVDADIQLLKAQIAKTEIRAPFDGVIGLKYVSEGSYISSTTRVGTLQNLSKVKIDFSIPEKYLGQVETGADVVFTVSGTARQSKGRIYAIEPKIDLATRTIQLRALCENPGEAILPGAFASIEVVLKRIDRTLLIPSEALIPELKRTKVFLYKSGRAVSQQVEPGLRTETSIQILNGLSENDTLLTTGILQLRDGAPVTISQFD